MHNRSSCWKFDEITRRINAMNEEQEQEQEHKQKHKRKIHKYICELWAILSILFPPFIAILNFFVCLFLFSFTLQILYFADMPAYPSPTFVHSFAGCVWFVSFFITFISILFLFIYFSLFSSAFFFIPYYVIPSIFFHFCYFVHSLSVLFFILFHQPMNHHVWFYLVAICWHKGNCHMQNKWHLKWINGRSIVVWYVKCTSIKWKCVCVCVYVCASSVGTRLHSQVSKTHPQ